MGQGLIRLTTEKWAGMKISAYQHHECHDALMLPGNYRVAKIVRMSDEVHVTVESDAIRATTGALPEVVPYYSDGALVRVGINYNRGGHGGRRKGSASSA